MIGKLEYIGNGEWIYGSYNIHIDESGKFTCEDLYNSNSPIILTSSMKEMIEELDARIEKLKKFNMAEWVNLMSKLNMKEKRFLKELLIVNERANNPFLWEYGKA